MTELLDLPRSWLRLQLADAVRPRGEKAIPTDHPDSRFVGMDHVEAHTGRIIGGVPAITMKSAAARFRVGDVLYGRLRPYLNKVTRPPFDGLASAEFIVFPENGFVSNGYLMHRLRSRDFVGFASHLNEGDRPRVDFSQIGAFSIEIPPLPEQHRIVAKIEELFSELDAGEASLTRARAQLALYRQSLLKAAFQGHLTADWRAANPDKLEAPQALLSRIRKERETRYKQALDNWQTALSEWRAGGEKGRKPGKPERTAEIEMSDKNADIPRSWLYVRVEGLLAEPLSNGRSVKDKVGGFPVLRLTAFHNGRLDLTESKAGAWTEADAAPWIVKEGDFFAARGNGSKHLVGIGALAVGVGKSVAYPDTMIRLAVDREVVDPEYFAAAWNSRVIRDQIESAARTTAGIYKINQPHICGFVFPLPPREEQERILKRIIPVLSQIEHQEAEITTALARIGALRQSILKQAFSGRLVPQDPSDEPASVLLSRLRAAAPIPKTRRKTPA